MPDRTDKRLASAQANDLAQLGASNGSTHAQFPHIRFRTVEGAREPFVLDTGLAVWEIAWLAQAYGPDVDAIADHTLTDHALLQEGFDYAAEHETETAAEIKRHTDVSLEELRRLLPGLRVLTVSGTSD